jgi:hypothetical protein
MQIGQKTVSRRVFACATRTADIEEGDLAELNPLAGLAHMQHLREAPLLPSLRAPTSSVIAEDDEGGSEEAEVPRPGG